MQNYQKTSQALHEQIHNAKKILIISHQKPDGDTLGANMALTSYLLGQKKDITSFCLDRVPEHLQFLPNFAKLTNDQSVFKQAYDTVIVVDSGSLPYAGVDQLLLEILGQFTLIDIDHHASNDSYGDINLVITDAASTTEILYRLFKHWDINWNSDIATALACGLITDTGGLKNPATGYHAMAAMAALKNHGANIYQITQQTIKRSSLSRLRLWGRALARLDKIKKYNLAYTYITAQDYIDCASEEADVEGISNFLHILQEGEIIMVLRDKPDQPQIIASLRTTGDTDLSQLAKVFGGGGHKKAAGFSLSGKLLCDKNKLRII